MTRKLAAEIVRGLNTQTHPNIAKRCPKCNQLLKFADTRPGPHRPISVYAHKNGICDKA